MDVGTCKFDDAAEICSGDKCEGNTRTIGGDFVTDFLPFLPNFCNFN